MRHPTEKQHRPKANSAVVLRNPTVADAAAIWRLAGDGEELDLNSPYCYLLLCQHFADTCLVAERDGDIVGFQTTYRLPLAPHRLFLWQVRVAQSMRRRGLAASMLDGVIRLPACAGVTYLTGTTTRSNLGMRALARRFARKLKAPYAEEPCFPEHLFPNEGHEAEHLFQVGPFDLRHLQEEGVD